jgi:hypothetical protein
MIHDLELTTVVDAQGVLTEKFTDSDNAKIDKEIELYSGMLYEVLVDEYNVAYLLSEKLAIIDLMRKLEHPRLSNYVKRLQDEL